MLDAPSSIPLAPSPTAFTEQIHGESAKGSAMVSDRPSAIAPPPGIPTVPSLANFTGLIQRPFTQTSAIAPPLRVPPALSLTAFTEQAHRESTLGSAIANQTQQGVTETSVIATPAEVSPTPSLTAFTEQVHGESAKTPAIANQTQRGVTETSAIAPPPGIPTVPVLATFTGLIQQPFTQASAIASPPKVPPAPSPTTFAEQVREESAQGSVIANHTQREASQTSAIADKLQRESTEASAFADKIFEEFTVGSGIAPELFAATVSIHSDVEEQPGGEVAFPIHEALNWHLTRFGQQARPTMFAALLINEDGSVSQAKLSEPLTDKDKGKQRKYENPKGAGSKPFLPAVTIRQWVDIAKKHNLTKELPQWVKNAAQAGLWHICSGPKAAEYKGFVNLDLNSNLFDATPLETQESNVSTLNETFSFWDWLAKLPEISIAITEGVKKTLCLLSKGYVAIGLIGVNGGYRTNLGDKLPPKLIPELERFCTPGRKITLAFDQDAEAKTQRRVQTALMRFGGLLIKANCEVSVATWDGNDGKDKGIDDLIVNQGLETWEKSLSKALTLDHWRIFQRLDRQLTYPVNLKLNCADLSKELLDALPQDGIIAIASSKGTGKTKLIAKQVKNTGKALLATHRIALARHLCHRLEMDYRGDLDRINGQFITGSAYTLRVGFCVDSLLAINPETFRDCDLVIDEIVQVVRHLLTSSTCNRDGKRPALLARFAQLVQVARRVIVADADLNNATLDYLKALRGEGSECFLIQNNYQLPGYPVKFLKSPNRSAICNQFLTDLQDLNQGEVLLAHTDTKGLSKTLFELIRTTDPEKRVLLINSETSGGEAERAFIENPDNVLKQGLYDIIICSPSVFTGTSIESQGIITKVYGIFMGFSSTDADMAQALARVREPVPRVVWCTQQGHNYCKVSRSTNPLELKGHLFERTKTTTSLIRSSLKADSNSAMQQINWHEDPNIHLFARISAEQNRSMYNLRDALLVRLIHEGHCLTVVHTESDELLRFLLQEARDKIKLADAQKILQAEDLSYSQILALEQLEVLSPDQHRAISKFHLKEFYCLEELTLGDILADRDGRWRGELLNLEAQLQEGVALDRTVKALEKQVSWRQNLCPWDIPGTELRREIRDTLGLTEFLEKAAEGQEWIRDDLAEIVEKAREFAPAIKAHLNFSVTDDVSDVQVVHQLLSQLGVKTDNRWTNLHPDHLGEKIRVYSLKWEHWDVCMEILKRRQERRQRLEQEKRADGGGSPLPLMISTPMGDPGSGSGLEAMAASEGGSQWADFGLRSVGGGSEGGNQEGDRGVGPPDDRAIA